MKKRLVLFGLFTTIIIISACKSKPSGSRVIDLDSVDLSSINKPINPLDTIGEGLPIFYNMYLSVELSSLFETVGAVFESDLMNSTDRISGYLTSSQQAINLGIFAVDLSYARVFDQVEIAGRYFNAMQQISKELGIPNDYFRNTADRFERNISDKDSLIKIANEVYLTTDEFLKENERYTTAALIILGGWTEAIYIAIDVAIESRDPEIIEKLVDQKYSLNNVMIMLSEHRNSEVVAEYLTQLTKIKNNFNNLNISFDSNFKPETPESQKKIDEAIKQIESFRTTLDQLRNSMIR